MYQVQPHSQCITHKLSFRQMSKNWRLTLLIKCCFNTCLETFILSTKSPSLWHTIVLKNVLYYIWLWHEILPNLSLINWTCLVWTQPESIINKDNYNVNLLLFFGLLCCLWRLYFFKVKWTDFIFLRLFCLFNEKLTLPISKLVMK